MRNVVEEFVRDLDEEELMGAVKYQLLIVKEGDTKEDIIQMLIKHIGYDVENFLEEEREKF